MSGEAPEQEWVSPGSVPDEAFAQQPEESVGTVPTYQSLYQPSAEEIAAALERKHKRRRTLWKATAVVAVVALAGSTAVFIATRRHGNSVVSAVKCAPAKLSSCLIKLPAGALQLSDVPAWDEALAPSTDAYAANVTGDSKSLSDQTAALLAEYGESATAHTDWNAVDGDDVDMVLLKFTTIKGAQSWNTTRNAEILAAYTGRPAAIAGDSAEQAHAAAKADAAGKFHAAYSAVVGNIVLSVGYTSPSTFAAADLQNWAGTELASLRSERAPAADPAETAPSTQQVACSGLHACLASVPSGYERWTSPLPSGFSNSSTWSSQRLVDFMWLPKNRQDVLDNFSTYDVTGVAHTDWMNGDATDQADAYLIQTLTQAGATTLAQYNFGEPNWRNGLKGIGYTIPGQPDTQAWYSNKTDSGGFIEFSFTAIEGNTIVLGWCYFYGSMDKSLADKWADDLIDRAKATVSTQPLALPPLTAPAVKVPVQGTCPASGDCLLPVPAGAKESAAASAGPSTADLSADIYANTYESGYASDYAAWLGTDGFRSAEHRSWAAGDGATADGALVKFSSPAQAKASVMLEYGLSGGIGRICTVGTVPDSYCLASTVGISDFYQMETVTVLAWKGDYEFRINVTTSNRADLADAYAWTEQQLALLPAS
ncbi:hypothetical protein KDL01_38575 [Actinospica durhamensis]|uniref:Uncharacterized protein n=1 Tax=Actinospica durhamensis TaxID=1508375 RepID=A0A941IUK5_9ACTN|nr:hypothetical protein [Actinospica durhamensis]MBR7839232.1 hypothetical protein [Actinospica durhamensis]